MLFGLVWTSVLAKGQRKFCAIPFFLLGMVFTVAKVAAREDWHYAETGTGARPATTLPPPPRPPFPRGCG